jgi:hypothetical protein
MFRVKNLILRPAVTKEISFDCTRRNGRVIPSAVGISAPLSLLVDIPEIGFEAKESCEGD